MNVDLQRKQVMVEITQLNRAMVQETSWWCPPDYYALSADEQFISIVRNHRADTVKEMINTYIQDGFQNKVLDNQNTIRAQLDQSLQNQQKMIQLQRVSNVLLMGNLIANIATARSASDIAASNQDIAYNTAATANNTASAARDADAMARMVGAKW